MVELPVADCPMVIHGLAVRWPGLPIVIVGIVGLMGLINQLEIPPRVLQFDMWVMLFSVILLLPFMFRWIRGLGRAFASMFLLLYMLYIYTIANDLENIFDFVTNI